MGTTLIPPILKHSCKYFLQSLITDIIFWKKKKKQDAYALCRVFKKSLNIPKVGENYVTSASDRSSSIDLHCEGKYDDLDSSDYPMMPLTSSTTINVAGSSSTDATWAQYLSEDAFTFSNNPYPNCAPMSYPPSKVSNFYHLNRAYVANDQIFMWS